MKNLSETKRKFKKENIVGKSIDKNKVNKVAKSSKTVSKINPKVVKENIKVKHKVNSPGDWYNKFEIILYFLLIYLCIINY